MVPSWVLGASSSNMVQQRANTTIQRSHATQRANATIRRANASIHRASAMIRKSDGLSGTVRTDDKCTLAIQIGGKHMSRDWNGMPVIGNDRKCLSNVQNDRNHMFSDRNERSRWTAVRLLFILLMALLLLGGFTFMRSFASSASVPPQTASESVIYVDEGDTLWSLAAAIKDDSMDTREVVHLLKKRNQLDNHVLRSGQTLIVPAGIMP